MKHFYPRFLLSCVVFLVPLTVLGADPKPEAADSKPSASGDSGNSQAASQDQPEAKTDAADATKEKRRKNGTGPSSIDIVRMPGGLKALNIHFRWSLYPNSSVELRLVPGEEQKGETASPVYFSEHLKGKVRDSMYTCLDHTGEGGYVYSFSKDKVAYKMMGRRNSLDKQSVHVQILPEEEKGVETKPDKAAAKAENVTPAAAYLQLSSWSVDAETLSLDLARDEFAKPGTLFVWFFRGDKLVWDEQLRWEGYK